MKRAPYRDGAAAYRGTGLGQAIPVHPTENNQPGTNLIGFEAPRTGDTPKKQQKAWTQTAPLDLTHPKAEIKARMRDQKAGRWNLGIHPAAGVAALDVDDADQFRRFWAGHGLPLPPSTPYSTARGAASERRQLVYRVPEDWDSDGRMGGGEIIDYGHRFIRAWPSVHLKTGNTYQWYAAPEGGSLAEGTELDAPPSIDDLTELPPEYVAILRRQASKAPRRKDRIDVEEWLSDRPGGEVGDDLQALVDQVPTEGIDDNDVLMYLAPVVRAAWDAPGGATAVQAAIDRYSSGYGRDAQRAAFRAVSAAIVDETTRRAQFSHTFDLDPVAARRARERKPKKGKKDGKRKKLRHDEYTPRGTTSLTSAPSAPFDVAADLIDDEILPPLLYRQGSWHVYADARWSMVGSEIVENLIWTALAHAKYNSGQGKTSRWLPSSGRVREVMRSIQVMRTLPAEATVPGWTEPTKRPDWLVPARDCLLDPRTGKVYGRSQRFFSLGFIDADLAVSHRKPKAWLRFLRQLWGDDAESIALLQEWMGYVLSGDTRRHKGLLLIGPKRSGKGTILHIAEALVGGSAGAFAATMTAFAESFGLEQAEGRSLLTVGDLRGSGREAATAAQKLLEIIGGDSVYVNRKNRQAISTVLRTRVMIASNSMPKLYDDAGVVESRFLVLRMTRSFAGHEDIDLLDKLTPELGGIAQWALEGYRRLIERDAFTIPASDEADRSELRVNSAPITEFIDDACALTDDAGAPRVDVWRAYQAWCGETGAAMMEQQQFGTAMAGAGHPAHRPRPGDGSRGVWRYRGIRLLEEETAEQRATRLWKADHGDIVTHTQ